MQEQAKIQERPLRKDPAPATHISKATALLEPLGVREVVQCGHGLQAVGFDAVQDLAVPVAGKENVNREGTCAMLHAACLWLDASHGGPTWALPTSTFQDCFQLRSFGLTQSQVNLACPALPTTPNPRINNTSP